MSDNWYTDHRQNRRLQGLEEDLSSVSASLRSSQRRLHAELSKVSGSLEQRLNRLSAAFDAFVEISDLRVTLGLFDAQGRVRHQARQLFAGAGPDGEMSDVDAYWLAPALVALRVAADGVADTDSLELAKARDTQRATVFHVLGTGLLGGRGTVTAAMLADALPVPAATLPRHQRAVWTLAADGFFGEAGWELVRRRGVDFVGALSDEDRAAAVDGIRKLGTAKAEVGSLPREFEGVGDLGGALAATAGLSALRSWVEEVLAAHTNEPAVEIDPEVRRAVELLVEEGSPAELPLLARERELRVVIEGTGSEPPVWHAPVGETIALLRTDAADAEHPGRRAVAVRISGSLVLDAAERLATVARGDVPDGAKARTRQGSVAITTTGPEHASLAKARSRIDAAAKVSGQGRAVAYGALGVSVLFLVLTVVAGWGWVIVALGALAVAAVQWRKDVQERATAVTKATDAHAQLAKELESRVATLTDCHDKLRARRPAIDDDLEALRKSLA